MFVVLNKFDFYLGAFYRSSNCHIFVEKIK